MWNGWAGEELEIDLSRKSIKKSQGNRELYEAYLTGRGLITKLFWDRVRPETEPFSPDNPLIFGVSSLVATAAPAANQTHLVTKSPLTGYLSSYATAGHWGPEFKFAGYDTLFVSGKSATPVYIYINNDKVEIRDASHLWGKGIPETQELIREELKDKGIQSLCIGPAGENKLLFATIEHAQGHSFSRRGTGAVMGDKKLKAIAVRGTRDINIANPAFFNHCDELLHRPDSYNFAEFFRRLRDGTEGMRSPLGTYYRNFEFMKPWPEVGIAHLAWLDKRQAIKVGCYNCPWRCINSVRLADGTQVFAQCRPRWRFMNAADIQDYDFNYRCVGQAQKYGFDVLSAAAICAFAIDLYQKGILTKEDTGFQLEWGNPEIIPALMEKIVRREGIGDILADGVYRAAQKIGRGSEQYACHTRKNEPRGTNLERNPQSTVRQLLSDRNDANQGYGFHRMAADCAGTCAWPSTDGGHPFVAEPDKDLALLVSYATGIELDETGLAKYIRRTKAIIRAYNSILGERQTIDDINTLVPDAAKRYLPETRAKIGQLMAQQNQGFGYSPDGIPTGRTLEELGLGYVAGELERRRILPEQASVSVS